MASQHSDTVSFSTPLPRSLDSRIYVRLTTRAKCLMLFVTGVADGAEGPPQLGSFVYALPNRYSDEPLCTHFYVDEPTLEFAERLAKLLARRTKQPVYVSNSLQTDSMGLGGTVEEVLEALQAVVRPLMSKLEGQK